MCVCLLSWGAHNICAVACVPVCACLVRLRSLVYHHPPYSLRSGPHFISEFAGSSHLSSLLSSFSSRPWGSGGLPHHLPFTWVLGTELHSLPLFCVQETVHHFSRQLLNWKHGIQETHCFQMSERKQPKILYLTEILLKKANNIMTFSGKQ